MGVKRKKHKLNEQDFEQIRQPLSMGASQRKVAEFTGWSKQSVTNVAKFDTFKDYQAYLDSLVVKYHAKYDGVAPVEPSEELEDATNDMLAAFDKYQKGIDQKLDTILEALRSINESSKRRLW